MKLSVIIPTLNEAERIAAAIQRAWEAGAFEVLVCDGGSSDETVTIARQQRCRVLLSDRGRATQQNRAAAVATGDVLLFLHADTWLAPGCAAQIETALTDSAILCGAFRQQIEADGTGFRMLEYGNALRAGWFGMAYGDQGIFVRRATFERIGGFPDVALMEDVRLMRRLRREARPVLLDGPLHVSARRWRRYGVVRQTLRNWSLLVAERCGVSPERLARFYPRN